VMLYSGGFFSQNDKAVMAQVRSSSPDELREHSFVFEDARLDDMLFRYRARNFPESLSAEELQQWHEFRYYRLTDPEADVSISMEEFLETTQALLNDEACSDRDRAILEELQDYSDSLLA